MNTKGEFSCLCKFQMQHSHSPVLPRAPAAPSQSSTASSFGVLCRAGQRNPHPQSPRADPSQQPAALQQEKPVSCALGFQRTHCCTCTHLLSLPCSHTKYKLEAKEGKFSCPSFHIADTQVKILPYDKVSSQTQ